MGTYQPHRRLHLAPHEPHQARKIPATATPRKTLASDILPIHGQGSTHWCPRPCDTWGNYVNQCQNLTDNVNRTGDTVRLTRLKIDKFRAIRDADKRIGEELALVGQNSAGKTSVLRALNAFFNFEQERASFEPGSTPSLNPHSPLRPGTVR